MTTTSPSHVQLADATGTSSNRIEQGDGWLTTSGTERLFRRWIKPSGAVRGRLLVLHGYGDHSGRFVHVMKWFAARGIACEAFDFRGHGLSSGKRGFVRRWDEYLDDLQAGLQSIRSVDTASPLFLLGHSHGGLVAAAAGVRGLLPADVKGCVLSAPYLQPAKPVGLGRQAFASVASRVLPALRVRTGLTPEMMTTDPIMLADTRADRLLLRTATPKWYVTMRPVQEQVMASPGTFKIPVLCLAGDDDTVASTASARIFTVGVGTSDWQFDALPGQRHEILRESQREKTFERIWGWLTPRLAVA